MERESAVQTRKAARHAGRGVNRHGLWLDRRGYIRSWPSFIARIADRPTLGGVLGLILSLALVPVLESWPGPKGALAPSAPLIFLLPVVLASTFGGWWSGLCVTVVAVLVWDWFFLGRTQSLAIDSADDIVTLAVYLTVAALVGRLSRVMRSRARAAVQHEAELAAVLDVTNTIASTLDMAAVLRLVLEQVQRVIDCTSAAVLLEEDDRICIAAYRGPAAEEQVVGQSWPFSDATVYPELLQRRAPIILADLWETSREAAMFRRAPKIHVLGREKERSWLWVPLVFREQVIGALSLSHRDPDCFTQRQAQLALTIANQVAMAIENARLYTRSRETGAEEERNRLARELHDSVTQMLFSSSLIAEVLPRLWERDPDAARQSLEDLRLLTRGASAEMRTLLVELRPGALAEAKLEDLLRQLAESVAARVRIPIAVTVEGEHPLPSDVQVALYRIAQEALINAARHARASRIALTLRSSSGSVELTVRDDGRGFDPAANRPGHFGLSTMQERADEIGATLTINSTPGEGTEVMVRWQMQTM